jgi:hypothetical protein
MLHRDGPRECGDAPYSKHGTCRRQRPSCRDDREKSECLQHQDDFDGSTAADAVGQPAPQVIADESSRTEGEQENSQQRAVAARRVLGDHISSLTERQALLLYHRMSGVSPGSITDRLFS